MNIVQPIGTILAWMVCVLTGFFLRHSFQKEGLLGLLVAAPTEAVLAIWTTMIGEKEKGMARVQKYTDGKDIQLSE